MPSVSQQSHFLIIHDDKGDQNFSLGEAQYSIGRDPTCNIRLISQFVSRHHATLWQRSNEDGTYYYQIVDGDQAGRRSSNGLLINGRKLRSRDLENKDQVIFGPQVWIIYYRLERDPHTTQPIDDFDITLINPGSLGLPEDMSDVDEY
jgi:pSer/pThr/pTyr-binding forkhead associated (FHA) protein